MLTTELHSVQPTILLPSPDAARQCHLHREAEDDIVRKLIQLLAKFDVHSTVRDAMRIAEQLASDGDRLVTASEFRRLRDYVLIEVARSNGQRSGGVLEMTVDEFHRSSAGHGHGVVHMACHKTSTTYGSARLVLSEEYHRPAATFVTVRSGIVPQTCPYLFATASGGSLPASHLTASKTEAFRRDSLAVQDRRDTRARSRRRDSGRSTSPALVRPTASRARQQQSVLVHRCMTKDTYRRRTPAASPPPVPAWR